MSIEYPDILVVSMPYPAIVDSVNSPPFPNSQGWRCAPFLNGTDLYAVFQSGSAPFTHIVVYKSTDVGFTWTRQDTTHELVFNPGGFISCLQSGTKIYIASFNNTATSISLGHYDMATDLFTVDSTAGSATFINISGTIGTYNETTARSCNPVLRSDGSFVIPYVGTEVVGGPTFARTRFDVWNGAVWTVADSMAGENGLANNDFCVGSVGGSGDRTHVFYVEYNTKTLRLRTIKSDNSVTAAAQVVAVIFDPGGANTHSLGESIGRIAFNAATGELAIPYKDAAGHLNVATAISADAPVWTNTVVDTTQVIQTTQAGTSGEMVSAAFYSLAGLNAILWDSTGVNLFGTSRTAGVWGALSLVKNVPTAFPNLQVVGTNNIADNTFRIFINDPVLFTPAYLQAAGAGPAVFGPASTLALDGLILAGGIVDLPSVRSCCLLCEQPQLTGLKRPMVREKSLTYASVHTTA